MPNWRCANCGFENRPENNFCVSCGTSLRRSQESGRRPDSTEAAPNGPIMPGGSFPGGSPGRAAEPFSESRAAAEDFAASLSKISDMKIETPDLNDMLKDDSHIGRATTRDLDMKIALYPKLNYALAHCDRPLIFALEISNTGYQPARDVLIKAWIATDYGEPWQRTMASIPPQKTLVESGIVIPLTKSRLQQVREAEKATLRIDVLSEGKLQVSQTIPIEVLPYNEWYYHPNLAELTACFVQPNSESIEKIVSLVRDRLKREFRDTSLDGYQSHDPRKVVTMLEALYLTLQKDLQISYINPPPSFENVEVLPDGSYTLSQKVFFPEQIFKHRRGTCLDLALLCAACVERMGLHPMCFLIQGHAFFGAWTVAQPSEIGAIKDHSIIMKLVEAGALLPLNSTTFALTPPGNFAKCMEEGLHCLGNPSKFLCAVDIAVAHRHGFKPLPPLVMAPGTPQGSGGGW
jgi:hypothetical protein